MSKFAGKTLKELETLDYDLELEWQHANQQYLTSDKDPYFLEKMCDIDKERNEIYRYSQTLEEVTG